MHGFIESGLLARHLVLERAQRGGEFGISLSIRSEGSEVCDHPFDHRGLVGLFVVNGTHELRKGGVKRSVLELCGEIDASGELLLRELFGLRAPCNAGFGTTQIVDLERQAIQGLIEVAKREDAARTGFGVTIKAEGPAAAFQGDFTALTCNDAMSVTCLGSAIHIQGNRADFSITTERLQHRGSHQQMTVATRMDTIATTHVVVCSQCSLRLGHRSSHLVMDIAKQGMELRG